MEIRHEPEQHRFIAQVGEQYGVLDYGLVGDKTLDYRHTFVPHLLRGRGIATELVVYALDYAKQNNLAVIPTCPFVAEVIANHREYGELVAP